MRNRCEPARHRPPDPACEIPCSTKMAIFLRRIYARHDGGNFGECAAFALAGRSTRTACSAASPPRQGYESISSVSVMRICDSYRIWDYLSEWSERVLLNGIVAPQQRQSSRGQSILVVRGGRAISTHG